MFQHRKRKLSEKDCIRQGKFTLALTYSTDFRLSGAEEHSGYEKHFSSVRPGIPSVFCRWLLTLSSAMVGGYDEAAT